ncbi:MarR family transcriptional regulator [Thioclava sp. NG1]|uniref:MarR family winged helix-turn-helix transcriptional regulator n=1 Tax=Thioclava sp. NG1 TaxID=2182426 RepID=UPI000D61D87B|nr:MarR family transcriptional regulator [Thioclava sp. NG1]PWE50920.1 MarR family transcriptional regulator [Thioclava sp. NG1]
MKLEEFFPYRLAIAAEAFSRNLQDVYAREYGLTREEWRLMSILDGVGRISSLDIARRTTLDKVQVSRAAARLEARGLIRRFVPDSDRRLREYECTEAGRALYGEARPKVNARAQTMLSALPEEARAGLEAGVNALIDTLELDIRTKPERD